jgi:membrane protease YdiL (CAAX protease family)
MSTLVKKYPAISLFVLAFAISGVFFAPVVAGVLPVGFAQLGALGPSLAGIILAAIEGRKGGVRELLGRFLIWRAGIQWWAFVLLFPIIAYLGARYLFNLFGGPTVDLSAFGPLYSVVPTMLFLIVFAGMGEEFGWRGFAMPRLQARYNALVSSIIVGVIWTLWHLPMYFVEGLMQYEMRLALGFVPALLIYMAFNIVNSIQHTWVFNNAKGSVLLACVFHGAGNAWAGYVGFRGSPGEGTAFTVLNGIIALIIVLLAGPAHLSRKNKRNVLELEEG